MVIIRSIEDLLFVMYSNNYSPDYYILSAE